MMEQSVTQKAKAALAQSQKPGTLQGLTRSKVVDVLTAYSGQIQQALPSHLDVNRIIQMSVELTEVNPKLKECTASSLVGAIMQASVLGFPPVSSLGLCYFVPYGDKVQFQIGYRGWLALARRSGEIKTVFAECVYSNDKFIRKLGLFPTLEHEPAEDNRGEFKGVYAVVHYISGGYNFVYLTKSEVEGLRRRNKFQGATPSGAYATDYDDMAKAKAIKKLKAYLPFNEQDSRNAEADEITLDITDFNPDGSGVKETSITGETIDQEAEVVTQQSNEG